MVYYRVVVKALGPSETALVSGTIWGHLAWAVRYLEGESELLGWLEAQTQQPWLISSWMPEGMLPKPLLPPSSKPPATGSLGEAEIYKKFNKAEFVSEDTFARLRGSMSDAGLAAAASAEWKAGKAPAAAGGDPALSSSGMRVAHNRIDRVSGRTPEEGGLFFDDVEVMTAGAGRQFFVGTPSPSIEKLQALLDFVGSSGFGANASTGCGHFHFELREEKTLFSAAGTRAMSLSHGVLTANMKDPRYRAHTHYGKLGGHFATGSFSPFKYPVLMMKPGATFTPADEGPFGELLNGVHHDAQLGALRQHALHLPVQFTEEAS